MKLSTSSIVIGIVMVLCGGVALANPFAASLTVTSLVGMMFLVIGVALAWATFNDRGGEGRFWLGLAALLDIVLGVWLLANPLAGTVSLTLMVGALFFVLGLIRLFVAFQSVAGRMRGLLILSGLASVLIGALVFTDFGQAATQLLGVLLGIELLVDGAGLVALGLLMRRRF